MNSTLISMLDSINQLLAFAIVALAIGAGWISGQAHGMGPVYAIIGCIGGLIAAAVICGLLATLLEIEKHLRKLAQKTQG